MEKELAKYDMNTLPEALLREAKRMGFGDEQICRIMKEDASEDELYESGNSGALPVFTKWWTPAVPSLKPKRLFLQHIRIKNTKNKKSFCRAVVLAGQKLYFL